MKSSVDGDAEILESIRAAGAGGTYPDKAYWIAPLEWEPVRSPVGFVTGRRSTGVVIAVIARKDGKPDRWPDLCTYDEIVIEQQALDQDGTTFGKAKPWGASLASGEVDCSVYDNAP